MPRARFRPSLSWTLVTLLLAGAMPATSRPQAYKAAQPGRTTGLSDPKEIGGLEFRLVGPPRRPRRRAAGVPGDPGRTTPPPPPAASGSPRTAGHLEIDLRRPADRLDRLDRGGAVRSERRLRRHPAKRTSAATSPPATASTSRRTPARPGRTSGSRTGRSARSRCIRRTRTSLSRRCSATPSGPTRSAASIAPATAGRRGSRSSRRTRTPAPSDVAIDPLEPERRVRRAVAGAAPALGA